MTPSVLLMVHLLSLPTILLIEVWLRAPAVGLSPPLD